MKVLNLGLNAKCLCHFLFVQPRVEHCEHGGAEKAGESEPGGWGVLVGLVEPRYKNLRLDVWG